MGCAEKFSTRDLPPGQRLAAWRRAASDRLVELDFRILNEDEFSGSILHRDLAVLSLTRVLAGAHGAKRIMRSRRQIAKATEDFFLICLQIEGVCRLYQDGREAVLGPGEFVLSDSTRPYELVMDEDYQLITLRVPHRTLTSRLKGCETLTAIVVPTINSPARMLLPMAHTVCSEAGCWRSGVALDVADGLISVLAGGLRSLRDRAASSSRSEDKQVMRIKVYALAHLHDHDLSVGRIANALRLSPGYLHKLFQNEATTLDRWIWTQRLEACEKALGDPAMIHQTITEIAFSCGFNDTAHFSRSFRQKFGMPPREYRKLATTAEASHVSAENSQRRQRA
ncbi:MAG: helix-turn-helix domain-containing protein [Gammaproteobacteria bacterium]